MFFRHGVTLGRFVSRKLYRHHLSAQRTIASSRLLLGDTEERAAVWAAVLKNPSGRDTSQRREHTHEEGSA